MGKKSGIGICFVGGSMADMYDIRHNQLEELDFHVVNVNPPRSLRSEGRTLATLTSGYTDPTPFTKTPRRPIMTRIEAALVRIEAKVDHISIRVNKLQQQVDAAVGTSTHYPRNPMSDCHSVMHDA